MAKGLNQSRARDTKIISGICLVTTIFTRQSFDFETALIRREERSLQQAFGHEYAEYCRVTPRFWPRISRFTLPDSLVINPKLLTNAVLDGLLWFLALPVFEFIEYAHDAGYIRTWSLLY